MNGYINSVQSFGAVDGPGIRYVIFMQGCPLRCSCCHNPDTWNFSKENEVSPEEMLDKILRFRGYFGKDGGVTVSGGEALCQPEFVHELFTLLKKENIHTCIDTSGCILNDAVKKLLTVTDLVLLDIKYTNQDDYKKYVGCDYIKALEFLDYLEENNIHSWIRQVVIPTKNDSTENINKLAEIINLHPKSVQKTELLAFRKICKPKYDSLNLTFPFEELDEPTPSRVKELQEMLNKLTNK